jgi:hypothetical protein
MPDDRENTSRGWLDPIDRISEILFGLIMVLTCTGALSVVTAGRAEVKTMILGALGCNLAWGIIDAGLYLMGCLGERGRGLLQLRTVRQTSDPDAGRRALTDALPAPLVAVLSRDEVESMRQRLAKAPDSPRRPGVTKDEMLGALGICLLVFFSTFPVVIPFLFIDGVRPALRVSNAVAIAMLFICGYLFARDTGLRPWPTGLAMVAIGVVFVGVAIALGG